MGSVPDKVLEKIKIHLTCWGNFFFQKFCHLGNNVEKYVRATGGSDKMCACQITKAHLYYIILLAFTQQWLHERA